jgi:hypothetical protein
LSTHDLHLNEATFALASQLAKERNVSVEELIASAIDGLRGAPAESCSPRELLGAMSDYADELDEVVADAYRRRAELPWRLKSS